MRLWKVYSAAGAGIIAGYLALPPGLARDGAYLLMGLAGVVAILLGVRLNRPVRAAPWRLMAVGQSTWFAGDAVYCWYDHVLHRSPFPSLADGLYLAAYPLFATALAMLIRGRRPGRDREGLIDASIFTIGLALLSWVFLMRPTLDDSGASLAAQVIGIAYPLGDVLLVALLIRLLTTPGARTSAFRLLAAAAGALLVADTAYAALEITAAYTEGPVDLLWLGSYVLWGAAALHPSMRVLSEPAADRVVVFSRGRLVALCVASLVSPAVQALEAWRGMRLDVWAVVVSSASLFLLVILRMAGLLTRLQSQAGVLADLARTDSLTGLANRRTTEAELQRALAAAAADGGVVSLAMLDLDHFKAFNDTFGHQAGDGLLKQASTAWGARLPEGALLGRYGGEEFVLVLRGEAAVDPVRTVETLRPATPLGQTFSAGVAVWDRGEDACRLVARADVALYAAKRGGRDRVVEAEPDAVLAPAAR
ncbi:GGDEF domain-containing protein [Motilibacter deserti]|nr:GGDEF domain-containing protein [Motilibacter deserti]